MVAHATDSNNHVGSDSLLIQVGLEVLARGGPSDSCTLACRQDLFGQNLAQSARTKSDEGWFCVQYDPGFSLEEGN